MAEGIIFPQWVRPEGVGVLITNRFGGDSQGHYDSFNLAQHVGDEASCVVRNRVRLQRVLGNGVGVQWLRQVHGTEVVEASEGTEVKTGDAVFTRQLGVACAILTADCLPVLLCDQRASCVAAVHAGWRGLVNGVIANTVKAMSAPAGELSAFLGPAISQRHFEVGPEVIAAVLALASSQHDMQALTAVVKPSVRAGHGYLDLYALARWQLQALGVSAIAGGDYCTFEQDAFYSYRQQNVTGRQASLIWLQPE